MHVASPPDTSLAAIGADKFLSLLDKPLPIPGTYPHWDKIRHMEPPEGHTLEQWWFRIALNRSTEARYLRLATVDGEPFRFNLPDSVLELLHQVDQRCAGRIAMSEAVAGEGDARDHYLVSSLMEEAIRSSQLEGAATSRTVAKEMLRSGRPPRDRGETMILNNFRALEFIREAGDQELSLGLILELHRILTDGTLDDSEASGRLQSPAEERVAVFDRDDDHQTPVHVPPPAEELPDRLRALCDFANEHGGEGTFIHPVIRAVLVHFQLAYDHPFEDGNGRTARALFYWQMRRAGYWLTEYLSISKILRDAPAQYMRAFMLTETDSGDTTYFILHQLRVISQAIAEMDDYLARKAREIRRIEELLRGDAGLNHRQIALLGQALRDRDRSYSFGGHAGAHSVTHETARKDLTTLEERGLLVRHGSGRRYFFTSPTNLERRLQALGSG